MIFHLRSAGIDIWIAREAIPVGARWKDSIRQASDMLKDGSQAPGVPCDGISVGLGFTGKRVGNPTKVAPVGNPPPDPCTNPPADAGADTGADAQQ